MSTPGSNHNVPPDPNIDQVIELAQQTEWFRRRLRHLPYSDSDGADLAEHLMPDEVEVLGITVERYTSALLQQIVDPGDVDGPSDGTISTIFLGDQSQVFVIEGRTGSPDYDTLNDSSNVMNVAAWLDSRASRIDVFYYDPTDLYLVEFDEGGQTVGYEGPEDEYADPEKMLGIARSRLGQLVATDLYGSPPTIS